MIGINNPFNIRYNKKNKWLGQTGSCRGFCNFSSLDVCIRAAAIIVMRSYVKRGVLTYSEIVYNFAPPSENRSEIYLAYVCQKLGVMPFDRPASLLEYARLLSCIAYYESGTTILVDKIINVCLNFNVKPYARHPAEPEL